MQPQIRIDEAHDERGRWLTEGVDDACADHHEAGESEEQGAARHVEAHEDVGDDPGSEGRPRNITAHDV